MSITKLSILIPAYNEEKTIHLILDKVKAVVLDREISKEIVIENDLKEFMDFISLKGHKLMNIQDYITNLGG
jgi:glycosyltransferase involved in cell wall biosynthesis